MKNILAKLKFIIFYRRMPKVYCCPNCGAEQKEEFAMHIILCNSCAEEMYERMRQSNLETRRFLEEHKDEIEAFQKSEAKRLGYE